MHHKSPNNLYAAAAGEVWKASHKKTAKVLAIKKIPCNNVEEATELMNEIKIMRDCHSKYIVHFFGSCVAADYIWVCTSYADAYCSVGLF